MKRIMRKHLNDSMTLDTTLGRQTVACKIHKGLAVTVSLRPSDAGYRVTHVATGKVVTTNTFGLNKAWSVLLALEPLTDWTRVSIKDLAAASSELRPQPFYNSVCSIVREQIAA